MGMPARPMPDDLDRCHPVKAARLLYTPPPWILRGPIYAIFLTFLTTLLYAFFAKKEVLVTAPLRLEKETVQIEAIGGGLVKAIHVRENERVMPGDPLVTIQTQTRMALSPEEERLLDERFRLQEELARIRDEYAFAIAQKEKDLANYETVNAEKRRALEAQIASLQQQLASARSALMRAQQGLQVAKERLARIKKLYESGDATITRYEQAQNTLLDWQQAVNSARARLAQTRIALQKSRSELKSLSALRTREKLEEELNQLRERQARDTKRLQDRIKAIEERLEMGKSLVPGVFFKGNLTEYRSVYSGTVVEIQVRLGELVPSGTPLLTIVKDSAPLEGKIQITNRDIGKLQIGQPVKIKYHAFPYQEYGIQEGVIIAISKGPKISNGRLFYEATVALQSETVGEGRKRRKLDIGLEGVAEIKVGEKRLIELLFSPLSKFFTDEEGT